MTGYFIVKGHIVTCLVILTLPGNNIKGTYISGIFSHLYAKSTSTNQHLFLFH